MATGLSETDIRTKYITPAIVKAGWDLHNQIREEFTFTAGRIIVTGNRHQRGERKRVDYLLYYKSDFPIALIEAKDAGHSVGDGMQQALSYAESLDIPFVYSSNGHGFLEHDRTATIGSIEREIAMDSFPSPAELWMRLKTARGLDAGTERVITQDYYREMEGKEPRYYQRVAINRTVQAVAEGKNRILLVMATGTGKTFTAFQIAYRLWKSGMKKRILFLADRNVLLNQAKNNDFAPFGNKMTKITNRQVDKSYEVYLSLYQAVTGNEDWKNIYKQFTPGFFDLIVIDECHRGSAAEDSAWREILEYFSAATQIGMTATPKETYSVSNIEYFGSPIYIYSLKQGIEDGFLAPYKVIRVYLDKDLGWRPEQGQTDKYGREIEDREYTVVDYDNTIILEQRTDLVARRVSNYLKKHSCRFDKSIFFCQNIEHAEMLRSRLVNENSDLVAQYPRYAVRITGDSQTAEADLDDFSNPESSVPCLVTTSQLLTTGVDVKTCKFVVLDKNINSMIEFKQIVGRGTRIEEDYDKFFFTIIDFRNATRHFADPDFDGEPVVVKPLDDEDPDNDEQGDVEGTETTIGDSPTSDTPDVTIPPGPDQPEPRKFYIDDVEVTVACERVQYLDANGKLVTVSLKDYARDRIRQMYLSLDAFISDWNEQTRKTAITTELQKHGVFLNELADAVGADYDAFDLVCHIAFDRKPLTRRERAQNVIKRDYFGKYSGMARQVLEGLLDKYSEVGIDGLEDLNTLAVKPLVDLGTRVELIASFGGREQFEKALREMEQLLYTA
jgi:type I restriction enzyme R subunit